MSSRNSTTIHFALAACIVTCIGLFIYTISEFRAGARAIEVSTRPAAPDWNAPARAANVIKVVANDNLNHKSRGRSPAITGFVIDARNAAVADAEVSILRIDDAGTAPLASARSAADGRFVYGIATAASSRAPRCALLTKTC
ncbi:MAG: carboxypeptidase regulatory-like domain-containing protein [Planctomycetes bacterium]|nr:carboxypeptidase regulatory-like domain-containing protein [Planctomycetota bacterium]